jgi:hypothetical protein
MVGVQGISLIDVLFLLYLGWLIFGSKEKTLSGEIVHIFFRLLWIVLVLQLYTSLGTSLGHRFSFFPETLRYRWAFFGLFLLCGALSSLFINFTKVFFKPGENAVSHDLVILFCRLGRGVLVFSFFLYALWVSAVPSVMKSLESSLVYRTPVKNVAGGIYCALAQGAGSIAPFLKPDKEVSRYVAERSVSAGSGDRNQQRSAPQRID